MPKAHLANLSLRDAAPTDIQSVAGIYNFYVLNTAVTFEEAAVSVPEMSRRMDAVAESSLPYLIAEHEGRVVGYSYATAWRPREAYRFSAESTVYVNPLFRAKGIGLFLYGAMVNRLKGCGLHAVMGGIALPNEASVGLHEALGFRKVAHFEQVGFKLDRWIDVGYWQKIF